MEYPDNPDLVIHPLIMDHHMAIIRNALVVQSNNRDYTVSATAVLNLLNADKIISPYGGDIICNLAVTQVQVILLLVLSENNISSGHSGTYQLQVFYVAIRNR